MLRECTPTALFGIFEVLSSVGKVWPLLMGEAPGEGRFDVRLVSADGGAVETLHGIPVGVHAAMEDTKPDVIVVTDLDLFSGLDVTAAWPEWARWLQARFAAGSMVCSVCTGAVLLARAGLLDDLEATSHWSAEDLLRQAFPRVRVQAERILLPAGPDHRIVTCGGSASWEDLVLYLIARFCDQEEAVRTAKIYVFGDRSEGQLPYTVLARPRRHDDAVIGEAQEWVARHYDDPSPVNEMLGRSGLAERTFKRRFRAATGQSPMDYVQTLRVEEAKQLLESTDLPVEAVAREVGYEEPGFFRRLFKRRVGTTPSAYRRRFARVGVH